MCTVAESYKKFFIKFLSPLSFKTYFLFLSFSLSGFSSFLLFLSHFFFSPSSTFCFADLLHRCQPTPTLPTHATDPCHRPTPPTHFALTWLLLFFFFPCYGLWCGGGCGCVGRSTSVGGWVRQHQWVVRVGFVVVGVGVAADQP